MRFRGLGGRRKACKEMNERMSVCVKCGKMIYARVKFSEESNYLIWRIQTLLKDFSLFYRVSMNPLP